MIFNLAYSIGGAIARNQTQRELINSKNYLTNIINALPDPVYVKDNAHKLVLFNDSFCNLIGSSPEELIGKSIEDYYQEKGRYFLEKEAELFNNGKPSVEELTFEMNGVDKTIIIKKLIYGNF